MCPKTGPTAKAVTETGFMCPKTGPAAKTVTETGFMCPEIGFSSKNGNIKRILVSDRSDFG